MYFSCLPLPHWLLQSSDASPARPREAVSATHADGHVSIDTDTDTDTDTGTDPHAAGASPCFAAHEARLCLPPPYELLPAPRSSSPPPPYRAVDPDCPPPYAASGHDGGAAPALGADDIGDSGEWPAPPADVDERPRTTTVPAAGPDAALHQLAEWAAQIRDAPLSAPAATAMAGLAQPAIVADMVRRMQRGNDGGLLTDEPAPRHEGRRTMLAYMALLREAMRRGHLAPAVVEEAFREGRYGVPAWLALATAAPFDAAVAHGLCDLLASLLPEVRGRSAQARGLRRRLLACSDAAGLRLGNKYSSFFGRLLRDGHIAEVPGALIATARLEQLELFPTRQEVHDQHHSSCRAEKWEHALDLASIWWDTLGFWRCHVAHRPMGLVRAAEVLLNSAAASGRAAGDRAARAAERHAAGPAFAPRRVSHAGGTAPG